MPLKSGMALIDKNTFFRMIRNPEMHRSQCLKIFQNVAFDFFNCGFSFHFCFLILTCRVTLFDCKLLVYQKLAKLTFLGIFDAIWSTQNVNVARFARNVEWDYFYDFETLFVSWSYPDFWPTKICIIFIMFRILILMEN